VPAVSSFSLFSAVQWQGICLGVGIVSLAPISQKLVLSSLYKSKDKVIEVTPEVKGKKVFCSYQGKKREVYFDTDVVLPDLTRSRSRRIRKELFLKQARTGRLHVRDLGAFGLFVESSRFDWRLLLIPSSLFIFSYVVGLSGLEGAF
jgi:hypothetical protein